MKKWGLMLGVSFLCFSSFATDFELPEIDKMGLDEVRENRKECATYTNHTIKMENSPLFRLLSPVLNCFAYNIDYGLEPICEAENLAKEELERSNDEGYTDALESYLDDLENQKKDFIDVIYKLHNGILCDEFGDEFGDDVDEIGESQVSRSLITGSRVALLKDCERVPQVMVSKVEKTCYGINFNAINEKHNKK